LSPAGAFHRFRAFYSHDENRAGLLSFMGYLTGANSGASSQREQSAPS
tara:strand:- start:9542 stop:9685 length:144 start_codon:yes stop_codon:yes gene_type:complete